MSSDLQQEVDWEITDIAKREPLTLGELGDLLIAETGSPSRLVSGLVRAGLVTRVPSPQDGRAVALRLTTEGRSVTREIAVAEGSRAIDQAIAGHDADATLALLHAFVADRPTGHALARRGLGQATRRD